MDDQSCNKRVKIDHDETKHSQHIQLASTVSQPVQSSLPYIDGSSASNAHINSSLSHSLSNCMDLKFDGASETKSDFTPISFTAPQQTHVPHPRTESMDTALKRRTLLLHLFQLYKQYQVLGNTQGMDKIKNQLNLLNWAQSSRIPSSTTSVSSALSGQTSLNYKLQEQGSCDTQAFQQEHLKSERPVINTESSNSLPSQTRTEPGLLVIHVHVVSTDFHVYTYCIYM